MGSVRLCRALVPKMAARGSGAVVLTGSDLAKQPEPGFMDYGSCKAGLLYLAKALAKQYAPQVRVNTVLPGWVPTERQLEKWWTPEGEQRTMENQSIKRRIMPEEFAQMVLFLAADDGAACTAQQFLVDGGRR